VLDLIYIYEDFEEYEKCGELLNLVNQFEWNYKALKGVGKNQVEWTIWSRIIPQEN
jgi:hypothetical protein